MIPDRSSNAMTQLEKQAALPLNYEDPPYAFAGDIVDVADQVMTTAKRAASPNAHVWVPRGGSLSASLPFTEGAPVPAIAVPQSINLLINAHISRRLSWAIQCQYQWGSIFHYTNRGSKCGWDDGLG